MDIRGKERELEELKLENEVESERVSLAQKRALEREARQKYGRDWKKIIGGAVKHLRIDKDNLQTLHSLGVGGERLKELSNPSKTRLSRYR